MSSVMSRTLGVLELLSSHPEGLAVSSIAERLDLPASAAHRLLKELSQLGYVKQLRSQGDYALTIKLASMGLSFLAKTGIHDIAQPILDRLAAESGELVRLSVIDGDSLVWVGVSQGATAGLRYDPGREQGVVVHLASSAGGRAWLSALDDEEAISRVMTQGLAAPFETGPNAPASINDLLAELNKARKRGYAIAVDSYLAGMAAMAVPIRQPDNPQPIGCLSIAGPAVRLDNKRMKALYPSLQAATEEIASASEVSIFFNRQRSAVSRASVLSH